MSPASTITTPRLEVRMDCRLTEVRKTADTVKAFLAQHGSAELDVTDCQLALVEACNNAVLYALPDQNTSPIEIEILCDPVWIEIRITDHTSGMDWPREVPLPSPAQETGRGLYIIKSVMQETQYLRGNSGNTFILRRNRLSPPAPAQQ